MTAELQGKFDKWAPEMAKLLDKEGFYGVDDIKRGWWDGRYQIWFGDACFMVSEVVTYPRVKVGYCFMAGGDAEQLERLAEHLEGFYRGFGCKRAMFVGRKGWERHELTKNRGYEATGTMFAKTL